MTQYDENLLIRRIAKAMSTVEYSPEPDERKKAQEIIRTDLSELAMLMGIEKGKIAQIIEQSIIVT